MDFVLLNPIGELIGSITLDEQSAVLISAFNRISNESLREGIKWK